jgi:hypothetical protein
MNEEHLEDLREPAQTGAEAGTAQERAPSSGGAAPEFTGPQPEDSRERDARGLFLPGNRTGRKGGRPPGSFDLVSVARKRAKKAGIDLRGELWSALLAMIEAAKLGDTNAARIVFERLAKPLDKAPTVELHLEQTLALGPTPPADGELSQYLEKLQSIAKGMGLLPGEAPPAAEATPAQLPAARAAELAPLPRPADRAHRPLALPAPRPRVD